MNNLSVNNISFRGYDATRLRGLYMQGISAADERNILREIRSVLKKEGLELFVNDTNVNICDRFEDKTRYIEKALSIWGQDRKAFVVNKSGKQILCDSHEPVIDQEDLGPLSDFTINAARYMPRGGDYYIGHTPNGEKWLLINRYSIYDEDTFKLNNARPTENILREIFDVNPDKIYKLPILSNDLDEVVRPIGYPHILVNDYNESLINLEKMKEKFPEAKWLYKQLAQYITMQEEDAAGHLGQTCDEICAKLETFGFKPIRIGARYHYDINFINAITFKNQKGQLSYITNSTRKTTPELKYLETLFDSDLKEKVPQISDTYYISGGARQTIGNRDEYINMHLHGLIPGNNIMSILAERGGGIHCMCAEVPKF